MTDRTHIRKQKLRDAERIAADLFQTITATGLITAGKTEQGLSEEIFALAEKHFGIKKHWHKRIVRAGANTLCTYDENPPDLTLQPDDILFLDFGPIIDEWEADFGRTYVLGSDPDKLKLRDDLERAWIRGRDWFHSQPDVTGAEFYRYILTLARDYGWEFGGDAAGHLVGKFPHERSPIGSTEFYIHPSNHSSMFSTDADGNTREWILEIHFIDRTKQIGGFFEQLLTA
jgi:Xaa-Pro aminopeptidase